MEITLSPDGEPTEITEDILGPLGFRVVWSVQPECADVTVYKITSRGSLAGTPFFPRLVKGLVVSSNPLETETMNIQEADSYLHGFLDAEGYAQLDQGNHRWKGEVEFIKHCMLLQHLWKTSREILAAAKAAQDARKQN